MTDFQFLRSAEMLHIKEKLLLLEIKRKVKNPAQMQNTQMNLKVLSSEMDPAEIRLIW